MEKSEAVRHWPPREGAPPTWLGNQFSDCPSYGIAVGLAAVTLWLCLAARITVGTSAELILLLVLVALSAFLGGIGPGIVSTVLATGGLDYFLFSPVHTFHGKQPLAYVQVMIFASAGVLVSLITEAQHHARWQTLAPASIGHAAIPTAVPRNYKFLDKDDDGLIEDPKQDVHGQEVNICTDVTDSAVRLETHQLEKGPVATGLSTDSAAKLTSRPGRLTNDGKHAPIDDNRAAMRHIASIAPGMIFTYLQRPDGSVSFPFASPSIEEFSGISRDELAKDATPAFALIHKDDLDRVLSSIAASAETFAFWQCDFRVNGPAKGLTWLECRAVPQREADGSILWHGFLNDVTAHRQAEAAVLEGERKFQTYVENAPIAILVADAEGRFVDGNPAALEMLGYDLAGLTTLTIFDLHRAEDREKVLRVLATLSSSGSVEGEFQWIRGDGQVIWIQLRAVLLDNGYSVGFCHDITERKRSELDLKRTREVLEAFVDYAPACIAMIDRNMCFVRSSRKWRSANGLLDAPLAGKVYEHFPDLPARWMEAHRRALAGETLKGEDDWVRPDGQKCRRRWEVHPWGDAGMDTGGILIIFEDVTEAREMEARLRQAQKMEAVGQLAGGVAHDFNNLLQIIQGYTEILQENLPDTDQRKKYTSEVLQAARRASSLTKQLLALSRRQVLAPAVINLNDVIKGTSKMLRRLLREDIDFQLDLTEPLWRVEADADQFSQVLINLCVNARDAMPRGGKLTIATRNQSVGNGRLADRASVLVGDHVVLTIQDTGTGMDAHVLEHIFEPFFTTKDAGQGTGMGLSTVYGIVNQSGGHVWADTELGNGTCFTVCIPRTNKSGFTGALASNDRTLQGTETVLIVEDDESVRSTVAEFLPSLGYTVLTAHPSQALSIVSQHSGDIDLVITDVVMPDMSGPVLSEKLRSLRPELKTVFMSGYVDDAMTRHGILESNATFLQKPFTLAELAVKVREAIAKR
jgi:two-component system cell cycle sensor histidine kinase/response regulator CckA